MPEIVVSLDIRTSGESVDQFLANLTDYLAQRGDVIAHVAGSVPAEEYDAPAKAEPALVACPNCDGLGAVGCPLCLGNGLVSQDAADYWNGEEDEPEPDGPDDSEILYCCFCGLETTQREGVSTVMGIAHPACLHSNQEETVDEA